MSTFVARQAGFLAALVLLLLAWRGWAKSVRAELPMWRNGLCIASLILLSLNWLGAAALEVLGIMNQGVGRPPGWTEGMLGIARLVAVIVVVLAFAFRHAPRIQAILAGVLMFASLPLGYA